MASPDALRELVVVQDVLLQGTFPELPTTRLRVLVWWPTQANRQDARKSSTAAATFCDEEHLLTSGPSSGTGQAIGKHFLEG